MVSRRQILGRSRDDLSNLQQAPPPEDESLFTNVKTCFEEHIAEVQRKMDQIDDEIWAKVIVFERNRRIAKAYVRSQILTVNASDIGFDGVRLGLAGFSNPDRDPKTKHVLDNEIGKGCKIRLDPQGNIEIKRLSEGAVFVKVMDQENVVGDKLLRIPGNQVPFKEPITIFDINKFEENVENELHQPYPNREKLEAQCIVPIVFGKTSSSLLSSCSWVMIVNIVGLEMLRQKLKPARSSPPVSAPRPRLPVPVEEDGHTSSSSASANGRNLPPLPSRDGFRGGKDDYSYIEDVNQLRPIGRFTRKGGNSKKDYKDDDPYYCGMRARPTAFGGTDKEKADLVRGSYGGYRPAPQHPTIPPHPSLPLHPAIPPHPRAHPNEYTKGPRLPAHFAPADPYGHMWHGQPQQNYETEWEFLWQK